MYDVCMSVCLYSQTLGRQHEEALTRLEQEQKEELEALEEKLGAAQQGEEEKQLQGITLANTQVGGCVRTAVWELPRESYRHHVRATAWPPQEEKMREEIEEFESSLVAEREREGERNKRPMEGLASRKEDLLAEAEKKKQVCFQ